MNIRIASIDIFRAITMLLMIFVNDLWTLTDIPGWLGHARADQDFLGFSDIVFPGFLFIVGMSIPFAMRNRLAKGENNLQILKHIISRSLALLVMGFFTVNISNLNAEASGITREWYQIFMVTAFFMIWNDYSDLGKIKKAAFIALKFLGTLILLFLALKFKGGKDGTDPMTPQWWGILGLIGWTYLISAPLFLFAHRSKVLLLIIWLLFSAINIGEHAGWWHTPIPGGGAFQSFAFTGIAAVLLIEVRSVQIVKNRVPVYFAVAGGLFIITGLILHRFFIISKIQATPTWVFLCNGISFFLFGVLYFLIELRGHEKWFNVIKTAGTNTLTCYLIPYVFYSCAVYTFSLPGFLKSGTTGLIKSLIFAFLIIGITALLGKIKIKLKI